MTARLFRWLRHGVPMPDGWRLAEPQRIDTHHNFYAVLITMEEQDAGLQQQDGTSRSAIG